MNPTLFGSAAIFAYLVSAGATLHSLKPNPPCPEPLAHRQRHAALALAWTGSAMHLLANLSAGQGLLDFSFLSALSTVSWLVATLVLLAALIKPMDKLGIVVFPLAAGFLGLKLMVPESAHVLRDPSWPMTAHILSSILAYSFLNIAAIQAVLLAVQDWCLRTRHTGGPLVRSLPPLQTMEALLFQLIGAGFVLLTASLVSGFLFLENMFAQHLAHKTILSILAWVVFAVLLSGRMRVGWRGQTAIRWTLSGFVALMLAYFGSKMVLEWILGRT